MMNKKPSEWNLLFWMFCLCVGVSMAATGQFIHTVWGTLEGSNIIVAGYIMLAWSTYGILIYLNKFLKEVKAHMAFTVFFLVLLTVSAVVPFTSLAHSIERPIYLLIPMFLVGHFLHKKLTKGLGPTTTSTIPCENEPSKEN